MAQLASRKCTPTHPLGSSAATVMYVHVATVPLSFWLKLGHIAEQFLIESD